MSELYGRDTELGLLARLMSGAVSGNGGVVVVGGEAGIGKSSLLTEAARLARSQGADVLSTVGVESETRLPFAGLHQLLGGDIHDVDRLPARQRSALEGAFGRSDETSTEIFLVGLATLELLGARALRTPVLLVVEDAQWLDGPTCEVLSFVARRIEAEPIAMIIALRDGHASPIASAVLPHMHLDGLNDQDAGALLDARYPDLSRVQRTRLLIEAAGNPLALMELPVALQSARPTETAAHGSYLPLTARLEAAFASHAADLPPSTQVALLVASADDNGVLDEILRAAALLENRELSLEDLAPAIDARLVEVDHSTVRFRHPLVRSAIYQTATLSRRCATHDALARVLVDQPDRRVWHRAASTLGTNEEVATELEAAAERAVLRGVPTEAAAALERAAELSDPRVSRGRLLVRAAEIELELGQTDVALRQLATAKPLALGQQERTRLTLWLEAFNDESWSRSGRVAAFADVANEMANDDGTPLVLKALWTVAVGCWWGNTTQETRDVVVSLAERLQAADDDPTVVAVLASADPIKMARVVIERITAINPNSVTDPTALHLIGTAATAVWAFDLSWPFLCSAVDGLRQQGRLGLLAEALVSQSWAAIHLAKTGVAFSAADEAGRLARETGQVRWALAADLAQATVAGERGDGAMAETLASEAERELLPMGAQGMLSMVLFARGRHAVAHQRYSDGFDALRRAFDPNDIAYHPFVGFWGLADLIEAADRAGHVDEAKSYYEMLEDFASETKASYALGTLAYIRPLVADDEHAQDLFEEALQSDLTAWPCYRGRLLLEYGRFLRRRRQVVESRSPLRSARDCFDALGFDGLSEKARQELRASGEISPRRATDARSRLTAQELQIAQMAAEGLTNREIGERLYLSHRTVGYHLHRIFPKLGITSRTQLRLDTIGEPAPPRGSD